MVLFTINILGQTKDGFKGHKWGTSISEFSELKPVEVERSGNTVYYSTNISTLGGVEISSCTIGFYKGQFGTVMIKTKGYTRSQALLKLWQEAYGDGSQSNIYIEEYIWSFIGGESRAYFVKNSATHDAVLMYWSLRIASQQDRDEKNAAKTGISDL